MGRLLVKFRLWGQDGLVCFLSSPFSFSFSVVFVIGLIFRPLFLIQ
jgi:hypothetical protein